MLAEMQTQDRERCCAARAAAEATSLVHFDSEWWQRMVIRLDAEASASANRCNAAERRLDEVCKRLELLEEQDCNHLGTRLEAAEARLEGLHGSWPQLERSAQDARDQQSNATAAAMTRMIKKLAASVISLEEKLSITTKGFDALRKEVADSVAELRSNLDEVKLGYQGEIKIVKDDVVQCLDALQVEACSLNKAIQAEGARAQQLAEAHQSQLGSLERRVASMSASAQEDSSSEASTGEQSTICLFSECSSDSTEAARSAGLPGSESWQRGHAPATRPWKHGMDNPAELAAPAPNGCFEEEDCFTLPPTDVFCPSPRLATEAPSRSSRRTPGDADAAVSQSGGLDRRASGCEKDCWQRVDEVLRSIGERKTRQAQYASCSSTMEVGVRRLVDRFDHDHCSSDVAGMRLPQTTTGDLRAVHMSNAAGFAPGPVTSYGRSAAGGSVARPASRTVEDSTS